MPYMRIYAAGDQVGKTIRVECHVGDNPSMTAFGLRVIFDATALAYEGTEHGALVADWVTVDSFENSPGQLTVGGFAGAGSEVPKTELGELFVLKFTVLKASRTSISLTDYVDALAGATDITETIENGWADGWLAGWTCRRVVAFMTQELGMAKRGVLEFELGGDWRIGRTGRSDGHDIRFTHHGSTTEIAHDRRKFTVDTDGNAAGVFRLGLDLWSERETEVDIYYGKGDAEDVSTDVTDGGTVPVLMGVKKKIYPEEEHSGLVIRI